MSGWTTPADVAAQLRRLWDQGRILGARVDGVALFPLRLRVRRPDAAALGARFEEARQWIRALEEGGHDRIGYGYRIEWTEINHRQLGRNRVPDAVLVPTEDDALRLIEKRRQADRFSALAGPTIDEFPSLRPWIGAHPLLLLEHAEDWDRALAVLRSFVLHPRPGLYLRQLDIPSVDTKFIERRRGLLIDLLDRVLPAVHVEPDATGARSFERRYGLAHKPVTIRLRILDERRRVHGLSDLAVPAAQLGGWDPGVEHVFITENEVNGLAFPPVPGSLVIFGLGYSLERLGEVGWLHRKRLHYWGDVDTHGFAILDRLRASFPTVRSFLMDRETLLAHRALWVEESDRNDLPLERLTPDERALYDDLRGDLLGHRVRLEQERIAFGRVVAAVAVAVAVAVADPRFAAPSGP